MDMGAVEASHDSEELPMQTITTIGLDIAKSVFQVHGVDAAGQVVLRRQLRRRHVLAFFQKLPPCLVGIEACASSHHWSRELQALGHTVRLMPPAYVKPYVKRGKNDATDAEAICEAVTRPNMRFVPVKSADQKQRPAPASLTNGNVGPEMTNRSLPTEMKIEKWRPETGAQNSLRHHVRSPPTIPASRGFSAPP